MNAPLRIAVRFYRTVSGSEPVRDWLKNLEEAERQAIGQDLMRVQYRWPIGMPLCRPLGDGLWEVRTALPSNRAARVIFMLGKGELIALIGFIKKTRTTPAIELGLARQRKKEIENG